MSTRTPEGGDKPSNQGLSDFKVLPEQKGVGPRVQKSEEPKQQASTPDLSLSERFQRERERRRSGIAGGEAHNETYRRLQEYFEREPRGSIVFDGPLRDPRPLPQKPSEQSGEAEPFQPNPAELQAAERLGKLPPEEEVVETLDPDVEEAIRQYGIAVGEPEEAAQLREQAKTHPGIREFFKKGPISLASSSLDLSILRIFRKSEDRS
jgi:hypothetical protein